MVDSLPSWTRLGGERYAVVAAGLRHTVSWLLTPIFSTPPKRSRWSLAVDACRSTLRYCMQTEVHVYALAVAASALLSFYPFLIVMLSFCRDILRWPAAVNTIYLALNDYLPGDLGAFVKRNLPMRGAFQPVAIDREGWLRTFTTVAFAAPEIPVPFVQRQLGASHIRRLDVIAATMLNMAKLRLTLSRRLGQRVVRAS